MEFSLGRKDSSIREVKDLLEHILLCPNDVLLLLAVVSMSGENLKIFRVVQANTHTRIELNNSKSTAGARPLRGLTWKV